MRVLQATGIRKSFGGAPALSDGKIDLAAGSVHALCGGNGAGKSTFLSILTGLLQPDAGEIMIDGHKARFTSPAQALAAGIAIITQELSPFLDMTVAENLFLGREPRRKRWFIDRSAMQRHTEELLRQFGLDIDARTKVRRLSLAQIQLVEIAKAIGRGSRILVMDEPTSAIGDREARILFDMVRRLRSRGVAIIYVSHRLTDIFAIADCYTVFRDGRFVATGSMTATNRADLIRLIVGRSLDNRPPPRAAAIGGSGPALLLATGFSQQGRFDDINVSLHAGEVVGLYGLMGAGRSEFARALFGIGGSHRGSVSIAGQEVRIRSAADALRAGIAMVTDDRKRDGLVLTASIKCNLSLASLGLVSRFGFIRYSRENKAADATIAQFRIRARNRDQPVRHLSGGNQQKVVFARCLRGASRILICDEPTRGVDEAAKTEICGFLADFAAAGNAVMLISSETPELLGLCNRIVVFRRGRIAGELRGADATQDELIHLAA